MARRYGRAPRGKRVFLAVPHDHWKTTTFIPALRHDCITAPCVFDGTINGKRVLAWVKQALVPTLPERDIVLMGNFSSHKLAGVREAIKSVRATSLYPPPIVPISPPSIKSLPARGGCEASNSRLSSARSPQRLSMISGGQSEAN